MGKVTKKIGLRKYATQKAAFLRKKKAAFIA